MVTGWQYAAPQHKAVHGAIKDWHSSHGQMQRQQSTGVGVETKQCRSQTCQERVIAETAQESQNHDQYFANQTPEESCSGTRHWRLLAVNLCFFTCYRICYVDDTVLLQQLTIHPCHIIVASVPTRIFDTTRNIVFHHQLWHFLSRVC